MVNYITFNNNKANNKQKTKTKKQTKKPTVDRTNLQSAAFKPDESDYFTTIRDEQADAL